MKNPSKLLAILATLFAVNAGAAKTPRLRMMNFMPGPARYPRNRPPIGWRAEARHRKYSRLSYRHRRNARLAAA